MQDRVNTAPSEPVRVVGRLNSPEAHDLRVFLARNEVPYQWVDVDRDVLVRFLVGTAPQRRLPVVLLPDGGRLEAPSRLELAERVGLHVRPARAEYDVAILGAGPAGLTAAVYAASEGLRTIVIERDAPGGQAGTSSRIENYLGFPEGVSGQELTQRALRQAQRFGAEFLVVNEIAAVSTRHRDPFVLYLLDGTELRTRSAIVATGAAYRRLDAPGVEALTGRGVYYGAAMTEAIAYRDRDVFVVGGANSAGQAALHLAHYARAVTLLVRGAALEASMSAYLVDQIAATANIRVELRTQVARVEGDGRLEALVLRAGEARQERQVAADALFLMIGQRPATEWAAGGLARDHHGFLLTGRDLLDHQTGVQQRWCLPRDPLPLETSTPGLFAAGDVRHGSTKRVASAVGEGAMAIQLVHQYLRQLAAADAEPIARIVAASARSPVPDRVRLTPQLERRS
jgi:thioredoxin reductase (NADPH)